MNRLVALAALLVVVVGSACDRRIEPFDPDEQPREPDLSKIFPAGAERAAAVRPGLPEAPGAEQGRGAPPLAAEGGASGPPITGTVRLAGDLGAGVPQGAVLFIIARRGGAGPPVAVKRIGAPDFPLEFTLGPEDRMIQAIPFTGPLQVTARVDADGNATSRTPGDLQGAAAGSVEPGATGVDVVIDQVLGDDVAVSGGAAPALSPAEASSAAGGAPITGTVRLSDALSAPVPDGAVLFIIARRGAAGPPLAVKRVQAPRFPLEFTLGPEDRMIQAVPFAGPLQVTARVDADGNATSRTPGDLQGAAAAGVEPGATGVDVVIDSVL